MNLGWLLMPITAMVIFYAFYLYIRLWMTNKKLRAIQELAIVVPAVNKKNPAWLWGLLGFVAWVALIGWLV